MIVLVENLSNWRLIYQHKQALIDINTDREIVQEQIINSKWIIK